MTTWSSEARWLCKECRHIATQSQLLMAPNPFDPESAISGCPNCHEVNTLTRACDVEGCPCASSCGTPTAEAYRWTCHRHIPPAHLATERVSKPRVALSERGEERQGDTSMQSGKAFVSHLQHRDDGYVDSVRIETVERYKTSDMSGDEWRFSAVLRFFRKGMLVFEKSFHRVEDALAYAPWALKIAGENDDWKLPDDDHLCDQPGCANVAVSEYQLKERFSRSGERLDPADVYGDYRRRFCARHLTRGDCGREDADRNYTVISGPGPEQTNWSGANITESSQVIVHADSIEDVPEKVAEAVRELRGQ